MNLNNLSAVLFDLDGTLINTIPEIADSVNEALAPLLNGTPLDDATVQSWVGNGAASLFRLALRHCGINDTTLETEFNARWPVFKKAYTKRCGTNSKLYPGVIDCLQALQDANYKLGIVTNKEGSFAEKVLANNGLLDFFEIIVAGDTLAVKKPDPQLIWHTLDQLKVAHDQALFIGDSMIDIQTGLASGVTTWAVTYGYHHGEFEARQGDANRPERFIASFDELRERLLATD